MGDISTNKHYSDNAVSGVEGGKERDEGRRGREGRLRGETNGRKKSVLLCVRDCVVWVYCCHRHISFLY